MGWNEHGKSRPNAERIDAYLARTPGVLVDAQRAAFTKEGCTVQQKRLLANWVTATVNDSPVAIVDLLAASLDASRRGG